VAAQIHPFGRTTGRHADPDAARAKTDKDREEALATSASDLAQALESFLSPADAARCSPSSPAGSPLSSLRQRLRASPYPDRGHRARLVAGVPGPLTERVSDLLVGLSLCW
jgi:hypothetical protein